MCWSTNKGAPALQVGHTFRTLQAPARLHVPLPHRNLTLLSLAASYATQVGLSYFPAFCACS